MSKDYVCVHFELAVGNAIPSRRQVSSNRLNLSVVNARLNVARDIHRTRARYRARYRARPFNVNKH